MNQRSFSRTKWRPISSNKFLRLSGANAGDLHELERMRRDAEYPRDGAWLVSAASSSLQQARDSFRAASLYDLIDR